MFFSSAQAAVITNFILDTGSKNSYVPAETLATLDYPGTTRPGAEVLLRIQSVPTKFIVAHPGDAGRVGISFMNAGSLTYSFDISLVAPVLYNWSRERPSDVPPTISVEDLPRKSRLGPPASKILSHRVLTPSGASRLLLLLKWAKRDEVGTQPGVKKEHV
ncbi:hypothetical protein DFH09DRAFT_1269679 [Mycena vulgaris]|nr:hypothetical protein DFH09DRAFT_1269679 [Mycena vulgaris]